MGVAAPKKEWLVYCCFMFLGLGTLLPWNFFITADTYWQYKFRNTSNITVDSTLEMIVNDSIPAPVPIDPAVTELQRLFTPMLVSLSQLTNFSCLILNALFSHRLPVRLRLLSTLLTMLALFTVTTALVKVDSDTWQTGFFAVTMVIIVLLNGSGAIFQGGLFGLAGMFPPCYMAAVVTGQALGGVFAAATRIFSIMAGTDERTSALIFFAIAVVVMVLTVGALLYLMRTDMYKDITALVQNRHEEGEPEEREPLTAKNLVSESSRVFKEIWPIGVAVSCVFAVTLAVFPAVCVKIRSDGANQIWADKYFQPVMTFLLFNLGDYFGRLAAGKFLWPKRGSRTVYVLVAMRLVFIPLLLLCNHTESSSAIPSVFTSDWAYLVIMALFSLSNGYCGSICMIYGPKMVSNPSDSERAGSLMAAMLGLGLLLGAATSFGFGMIF